MIVKRFEESNKISKQREFGYGSLFNNTTLQSFLKKWLSNSICRNITLKIILVSMQI
jgi:hypothetical protein